jgi:hypothetical protein
MRIAPLGRRTEGERVTTPEAYARAYRQAHPEADHAALVAAVARWIAARERAAGGGVLDLGVWDERAWLEEAARAVARADPGRPPGQVPARPNGAL